MVSGFVGEETRSLSLAARWSSQWCREALSRGEVAGDGFHEFGVAAVLGGGADFFTIFVAKTAGGEGLDRDERLVAAAFVEDRNEKIGGGGVARGAERKKNGALDLGVGSFREIVDQDG